MLRSHFMLTVKSEGFNTCISISLIFINGFKNNMPIHNVNAIKKSNITTMYACYACVKLIGKGRNAVVGFEHQAVRMAAEPEGLLVEFLHPVKLLNESTRLMSSESLQLYLS